ncbi:MAG: glutamate--tRNA ligase, partial [Maribacter sp.]|nr:glutamate--tRNA ligase [Maribacter sp.]
PSPIPNDDYLERVVALIKERANFVSEFWDLSAYFFEPPANYDDKAIRKQWKADTPEILNELIAVLQSIENFASKNIESLVKEWISKREFSFGKVMPPLRLVIVGAMKGPHLFDILEMIGKDESISRIQKAISIL